MPGSGFGEIFWCLPLKHLLAEVALEISRGMGLGSTEIDAYLIAHLQVANESEGDEGVDKRQLCPL